MNNLIKKLKANSVIVLILAFNIIMISMMLSQKTSYEKSHRETVKQHAVAAQHTAANSQTASSSTSSTSGSKTSTAYTEKSDNTSSSLKTHKITKITRYTPTGTPSETVEIDESSDNTIATSSTGSSVMSGSEDVAIVSSAASSSAATSTSDSTSTVDTQTQAEDTIKVTPVTNSRLGVSVTSAVKPAVTYDVIRVKPFSLSAVVEGNLKKKSVSGAGAGIQMDIAKEGRYFAGAYGVYSIPDKEIQPRIALGMRF